jgi:hypothetical protein
MSPSTWINVRDLESRGDRSSYRSFIILSVVSMIIIATVNRFAYE